MAPESEDTTPADITESTALSQPTTQPSSATSTSTTNPFKKKKRKRHQRPHILHQQTLRNPTWCYIHLRHLSLQQPNHSFQDLDAVTAHLHLQTALQQFLGVHGSAIAFDILKLEGEVVWIRTKAEDQRMFVAAVGGWTSGNGEGWRVVGWSFWDAGVDEGDGNRARDLFGD